MPVTRPTSASAVLISNGGFPHHSIHGIEASVDAGESAALAFSYTLIADSRQLLIPLAAARKRVDGLWHHSCFEAFIGLKNSPGYYEFNFSPSSEWAAYRFRGYRDGGPLDDDALAPDFSVEHAADRLTLAATMRVDRLPLIQPGTTLRIGLAAVIERTDGSLSYWALKHPSDNPDFHHPDSFALELALPVESA